MLKCIILLRADNVLYEPTRNINGETPMKTTMITTRKQNTILSRNIDAHLPSIIVEADKTTKDKFLEYFFAQIKNDNTRMAYKIAVYRFLDWCYHYRTPPIETLTSIRPLDVAEFIRRMEKECDKNEERVFSDSTVKQNLAAIRKLFDHFVINQIIPLNPAASVKGPSVNTVEGKTAILSRIQGRRLLESIDTSTVVGLRDRALIGLMIFSFARISAVINMRVKHYYKVGNEAFVRLHEKGNKYRKLPAHFKVVDFLDAYIEKAGIAGEKDAWLFRSSDRSRSRNTLLRKQLSRRTALKVIKRRAQDVGLNPDEICCHSFRGTGITAYLKGGGTLENAAKIAGHSSTRTTQLYDRTGTDVNRDEIYSIRL